MKKDEIDRFRKMALRFRDQKYGTLPTPEGMMEMLALAATASAVDVAVEISEALPDDETSQAKLLAALGSLVANEGWESLIDFLKKECGGSELQPVVRAFQNVDRLQIVAEAVFLVWKDEVDRAHGDEETLIETGADARMDLDGMNASEQALVAAVAHSGNADDEGEE